LIYDDSGIIVDEHGVPLAVAPPPSFVPGSRAKGKSRIAQQYLEEAARRRKSIGGAEGGTGGESGVEGTDSA
jgi:hypothetical protein